MYVYMRVGVYMLMKERGSRGNAHRAKKVGKGKKGCVH